MYWIRARPHKQKIISSSPTLDTIFFSLLSVFMNHIAYLPYYLSVCFFNLLEEKKLIDHEYELVMHGLATVNYIEATR